MPFNNLGDFNRVRSCVADKNAGINILASREDDDLNDMATNGLGKCLTRDGQGQPTSNLPMATFRHTNVADGSARTDYAALGQSQDGKLNWVAAGGTPDAIAATYSPALTALVDGQFCYVRASGANTTTNPTFSPNGLTVHPITKVGGSALLPGDINGADHECILRYKLASTRWELLNPAIPKGAIIKGTAVAGTNTVTMTAAAFQGIDGQMIQFIASGTNSGATTINPSSYGAINVVKDTAAGPVALAAGDITANNVVIVVYDLSGNQFHLVATQSAIGSSQLASSAFGFVAPINLQINASVSSNLLTIAIKAADSGADPSAAHPVLVPFRDTTAGNGDPIWVTINSALSISTNATGATLGSSNSVPFRFWICLFNNAGTPVLALINCSTQSATAVAIFPLNESATPSTTAISGSATSAGVFYTPNGTTLASKAFRIIGYLEYSSGLVTAGTYNTAPTTLQLFGPGNKKPGDVVQSVQTSTTSTTNISSATKVATALTATITPTSAVNPVKVSAFGQLEWVSSASLGISVLAQIYRSTGSTAIGNIGSLNGNIAGGAYLTGTVALFAFDSPQSASATQYGVYGVNSSGTNTSRWLGTQATPTNTGVMLVEEVMG